MLDILFRSITIADGSGKPAYVGSVGVKDGKLTFATEQAANKMIEGEGLTLCHRSIPGSDGKGLIAEGFDADLVVLDRSALKDMATFSDPNRKPAGIARVYVAGRCVYQDQNLTGVYPGQLLRK